MPHSPETTTSEAPRPRALVSPEDIAAARERLAEQRRQQAELERRAAQATPLDPEAARRKVETAHEANEYQRLINEVVEAARGSVYGHINTSKDIMDNALNVAKRQGRGALYRTGQGWNEWGEAKQSAVSQPSAQFSDRLRQMQRELVINGKPMEDLSEVRIAQPKPDGSIEAGLILFVPGKTDEYGRPGGEMQIQVTIPQELAAKISAEAQKDPHITRKLVESLMADYGFPPEVMQSTK